MALAEVKGFTVDDFARLHPGGHLGRKLLKVEQLMHRDDNIPRVERHTPMRDAVYEMSAKGLGITAVTDADGHLLGCISDGDLRRLLEQNDALLTLTAGDCMHRRPGPGPPCSRRGLGRAAAHGGRPHHLAVRL